MKAPVSNKALKNYKTKVREGMEACLVSQSAWATTKHQSGWLRDNRNLSYSSGS